jgi:hypothetical protein
MKKFSSMIIGAGFVTAMLSTPAIAADFSLSGTVDMRVQQYNSTSSDSKMGISVDEAGSDDTYNHMYTHFDEAELTFKGKGKTANGMEVGGKLEMELGQDNKNDFELEEASAYIDFGGVKLIGGILQDWGYYNGTSIVGDSEWWSPKVEGSDESAALRLAITSVKNLDLDFKLRWGEESVTDSVDATKTFNVSQDEMRLQGKYDFGMGFAQAIWATVSNNPIDDDSAGDYDYSQTIIDFLVGLKFGPVAPWINMTTRNTSQTYYNGTEPDDIKDTRMVLGADFSVNKDLTITGLYMTDKKDDGNDDDAELTHISLSAAYNMKPVTFEGGYFAAQNNASDRGSSDDAKISGFQLRMVTKF